MSAFKPTFIWKESFTSTERLKITNTVCPSENGLEGDAKARCVAATQKIEDYGIVVPPIKVAWVINLLEYAHGENLDEAWAEYRKLLETVPLVFLGKIDDLEKFDMFHRLKLLERAQGTKNSLEDRERILVDDATGKLALYGVSSIARPSCVVELLALVVSGQTLDEAWKSYLKYLEEIPHFLLSEANHN